MTIKENGISGKEFYISLLKVLMANVNLKNP